MTSEQNVTEMQPQEGSSSSSDQQDSGSDFAGSNVPHGMGQSKSSRRRRRKRKNKGPETAPNGGEQATTQVLGSVQAAAQPPASQPQGAQQTFQSSGGQQQQGAAPAKRWKKKFRDRDRGDRPRVNADNLGNVASSSSNGGSGGGGGFRDRDSHQPGNNGFKRKSSGGGGGGSRQQRTGRSFVGPMDHSYRAVNGNFADTPPSTMDSHNGNFQSRGGGGRTYQGDSQPIDYSQGRPIPIAEDAPTRIYFFIEDLFITAKIQETARKLGVKVAFVKNDKESIAELTGGEEEDRPGLIVLDLNNANAKPLTLIPKLKTKLKRSTSIVGFLSHLQGDLKAKAVEVGCDVVMPRAAFSQNLPNLLRRYGVADEEEANFNQ
jgi:hypothetical protein